ncbi:lactonase, 7-bladed beta-propeller domain protein [Leptospira wolbachii serovar Codice str. CDC]|uniref:Lactonase, 7-bladed beta-propeller domain protein n=1 Tax=Leptospira wolbachii serovar Codice str. CDC TaxID=1218599 RepID=R9AA09_9LEPT|nr:lactonase, 7-bladed beta-propeller domain protein [Leptospira wolbachii serovar Codice str. CDC]
MRKILSIGLMMAFFFQCQRSEFNSACDPDSSAYLQTLVVLVGASEYTDFCGAHVRNPRIKIPRFILVTNVGLSTATSSINVFQIDPNTGAISQVTGSPFQLTNRPRYSVTNATGTIVYVANIGNTSVSILNLNPENGTLSLNHPDLVLSSTPYSLALDPNGKYLFASSEGQKEIHRMAIDSSGNLSSLTPVAVTANPISGAVGRMVFDSKGRHLYAGLTSAPGDMAGVQAFHLDAANGNLTSVNFYQTNVNNLSIAISANDQFVYGANYFSQDVFPFLRDKNSGALTIQTSISAGVAPGYAIVDPLNRFVYVANSGTGQGTISAYSIQLTNGALTPVSGSPFVSGFSPIGLSIDPKGKFLYSSNTEGGSVSGFTIGDDGSLWPMAGFPVTAGTNPFSIEIVSY